MSSAGHPTAPDEATDRPGSVRLRAALDDIPPYVPGSPGRGAGVFKLSSNESPFPQLPAVTAAICDHADDVNRYPQLHADRLVEAIAAHHDISAEQILVGNGSVAVAELVLRSLCEPGDEVVYAWRSFEAYPIMVQVTGASSVQVPLTADGAHDLDAMAEAITERTKLVIVCSPNNPTGTAVTHADLVAFLERVPREVMVLLDEAYVHFVRSEDPIDSLALLPEYKNLVILRTFAKAYGLAGLRVGYAIARRRLVRSLLGAATPFGVNALAQVAAHVALDQQEVVAERVQQIVDERTRVLAELARQGWEIPQAEGNFYWLPLRERSSAFAADALAAGVTVRPFAEGVRVTIGETEANDLVLGVTGSWAPGSRDDG